MFKHHKFKQLTLGGSLHKVRVEPKVAPFLLAQHRTLDELDLHVTGQRHAVVHLGQHRVRRRLTTANQTTSATPGVIRPPELGQRLGRLAGHVDRALPDVDRPREPDLADLE